jgi:hypothetical protein
MPTMQEGVRGLIRKLSQRITILERDRDRLSTLVSLNRQVIQYMADQNPTLFPTVTVGTLNRYGKTGTLDSVLSKTPSNFNPPDLDRMFSLNLRDHYVPEGFE